MELDFAKNLFIKQKPFKNGGHKATFVEHFLLILRHISHITLFSVGHFLGSPLG